MASASRWYGLFPLHNLLRNGSIALACGLFLFLVFGSGLTPNYSGSLLHPPAFPISYEHVTYCFQVAAFLPCFANVQDNLPFALVDFLFWWGVLSLGVFELIGLLSSPGDSGVGTRFSITERRIIGFFIIGVIGFSIFVPILPVPTATYTVCDLRAGYCRTITNYGSLTAVFLCTGMELDTTGRVWWAGCLYF